ncbi:YidC/Oxa1 family membrane protein insertase [Allorhizocola rhizosphaerae]|uniref:YidC/Oxa1 family membrane protein insertase n=1 Tax=Allorhizocola rhizosphaerae TaxID=1872709 RepID=UPI000E3B7597|nr:membrane protein insertase YidC [Allorhizocola rhizosphaerae]
MLAWLGMPAHALITVLMSIGGAAAAIVLTTVLIRILLVPVGYAQYRADQRRAALFERVAELQKRHRHNKARLDNELTALYRAEGGGLARGCLPMLVQIPVFASLYQAFLSPTLGAHTLLGVPLGAYLLPLEPAHLAVFAGAIVLLAAIGYASSRVARQPLTGIARALPYASVLSVAFLPLAATLYIVTTTAWTVAQTVVFRHLLA